MLLVVLAVIAVYLYIVMLVNNKINPGVMDPRTGIIKHNKDPRIAIALFPGGAVIMFITMLVCCSLGV